MKTPSKKFKSQLKDQLADKLREINFKQWTADAVADKLIDWLIEDLKKKEVK